MSKGDKMKKIDLETFQIVRDLLSHPIEVHSIFVDVAGSVEGGYFLSQVYRWVEWKRNQRSIFQSVADALSQVEFKLEQDKDGWFVWNEEHWMRETHMRDFELLRARNALSQVEDSDGNLVWEEANLGTHGYFHVRLNVEVLYRVIAEYAREGKGEV